MAKLVQNSHGKKNCVPQISQLTQRNFFFHLVIPLTSSHKPKLAFIMTNTHGNRTISITNVESVEVRRPTSNWYSRRSQPCFPPSPPPSSSSSSSWSASWARPSSAIRCRPPSCTGTSSSERCNSGLREALLQQQQKKLFLLHLFSHKLHVYYVPKTCCIHLPLLS